MTLPPWLSELGSLSLSYWQQLGLAFLLGSFTVATWSDLKYLSAQREFLEVWAFFLVVMAVHDAVQTRVGSYSLTFVGLKWSLIALLALASWRRVGWLLRLAPGDVAALAAAASLLPPVLVALFYALAKGLSLILGPLLHRGRPVYPFMPVVSLAAILVLALGALLRAG